MGFTRIIGTNNALGAEKVFIDGPSTAFGELLVADLQPFAQGDFIRGINNQIFNQSAFAGATISAVSGNCELTSGTNASGSATVQLRRGMKYRPGQGSLMKATAIFDTPSAGNAQFVGAGSSECGYFIGYFAGNFGILHSETGQREIRKLTVTTGAGTGDVTVTLNGNAVAIPVVGANDTTQTAYQLSLGDYSQVGDGGWLADAIGSDVYFLSARSAAGLDGTYSVAGASIVGTFAQTKAGEAQTNTFITSGSFNVDRLDGLGPSGMTLDPQKGNVYQISYQYLGYGNAMFAVEDPETGKMTPMHMIKNANARTTPVLKDPNVSILATSANTGGTDSKVLKTASMAAFNEGIVRFLDPRFSEEFTFASVNESGYVPLALLKSARVVDDQSNFGEFDLTQLNASNSTNNKTLFVGLFLNAEVTGDVNYEYVDEDNSIVAYASLDPSVNTITNVANLRPFYSIAIPPQSSLAVDLTELAFAFGVGASITVAIRSEQQVDGAVVVNWVEQQ
jgi:hypothetical protein